jgi:hypothetical protein
MKHVLDKASGLPLCGSGQRPVVQCLRCGGGPMISVSRKSHATGCKFIGNVEAACGRCYGIGRRRDEIARRRACRVWPDDLGKITRQEEEIGVR